MQIINEVKLDFDDVLIRPCRSEAASRQEIELRRTFECLNSKQKITIVPIVAANMDTVGTFRMAQALSRHWMPSCLHKFYRVEELVKFFSESHSIHSFYTMGLTPEDWQKLQDVKKEVFLSKICIDVANGYTDRFVQQVAKVREAFPDAIIMAGNVCTSEMTHELLIHGYADIIKIGIGPGSACETRKVTGIGYPQLSAIIECANTAHGIGGLICADGGCREVGDICKAFGAGADFVMLGGMLAGTDECDGEWEYYEGGCYPSGAKKNLRFYGMASKEAMEKYAGGVADYRTPEGTCLTIPYKGVVSDVVQQILGGLRSCCAYVGAKSLKDLSKCTTFVLKRKA